MKTIYITRDNWMRGTKQDENYEGRLRNDATGEYCILGQVLHKGANIPDYLLNDESSPMDVALALEENSLAVPDFLAGLLRKDRSMQTVSDFLEEKAFVNKIMDCNDKNSTSDVYKEKDLKRLFRTHLNIRLIFVDSEKDIPHVTEKRKQIQGSRPAQKEKARSASEKTKSAGTADPSRAGLAKYQQVNAGKPQAHATTRSI